MQNNKVPESDNTLSDEEIINHAVETLTGGRNQWTPWRFIDRGEGKKGKMPFTLEGKAASSTNPSTWHSYEEVKNTLNRTNSFNGAGLMCDGSFVVVDVDNCLTNGIITDREIDMLVSQFATYTDISPSGDGLHAYFKLTEPVELSHNKVGVFEVYTVKRFMTFSEKLFSRNTVRTVTPEELQDELYLLGVQVNPPKAEDVEVTLTSTTDSNSEVIKQKMFASKHGAEIEALYNGDTSAYNGDTSRAEQALLRHLSYWFNGDREAMRVCWVQSPLAQRAKTQERVDYQERSLDFALQDSSGTPGPELTTSNADSNGSSDTNVKMVFTQAETDLEDFLKLDGTTDWLVERLVTKESLNMIASPPAQGKTFMALNIALAVAYGEPLFGKFNVPETGNVLIVNEEDSENELSGRLQSMVPKDRTKSKIKLYCNTGLKVSKDWSEAVLERAKANDASLVILDNLAVLSLANENDAQAVQEVLEQFRRLTRSGITVIFIHHDRKGQQGESNSPSLDSSRGSGVIPAAVHGYLSVRSAKNNTFVVSQRKLKANSPKVKDFVVQMHNELTDDAGFCFYV